MRAESIWNTVGSLVVILPLLYLAFRSPWLVAVGRAAVGAVDSDGDGHVRLADVPLSAAATGAAAMLFGLGIDGVVLMFVALRHVGARRVATTVPRGSSPAPPSSMLLGMWTTAATFYGLTIIDFPSLQELGPLIGHSMMVCGVLTLMLVPALLPRRRSACRRSRRGGWRASSSAAAR